MFWRDNLQVKLRGLEQIQAANQQLLMAVNPSGGLGKGIKFATLDLLQYAIAITHVVTGTLQRSHLADYGAAHVETWRTGFIFLRQAAGRIYLNPAAMNPVTKERPAVYGITEHSRGGSHAFYERTVSERGPYAAAIALGIIRSELPRGPFLASLSFGASRD